MLTEKQDQMLQKFVRDNFGTIAMITEAEVKVEYEGELLRPPESIFDFDDNYLN